MKKKGFSLIELMVVIVIISILSSIAVPKLFGMMAKSKASELSPAARTYIKLQDAFAGENHQLGSWTSIGYVGPGTKVSTDSSRTNSFGYGGGDLKGNAYASAVNTSSDNVVGWIATSLTALNDVTTNSSWTITVSISNAGVPHYVATMPANAEALTPSFTRLGH